MGVGAIDLSWHEDTNTITLAKFADCTRIAHLDHDHNFSICIAHLFL